jgi:hypothetical protein
MTNERGTLLYDESMNSRWIRSYLYFLPQLGLSLMVFILGYMAIMSSAPFLGIGLIMIGLCLVFFVIYMKKLPPAQVYSNGIIFPWPSLRDRIYGDIFVPYDKIKVIIWIKKDVKDYIEVLFQNNEFRLELGIRDNGKFINACSSYVKVSKEEKSNYDKKKYLAM